MKRRQMKGLLRLRVLEVGEVRVKRRKARMQMCLVCA